MSEDSPRLVETDDEGEIGRLVIKAADQLAFVGAGAKAAVRFSIDGQWFRVTLEMITEAEALQ